MMMMMMMMMMKQREREKISSREKILLFFCFLNFFSPKKSLRQKTLNKLFFDQKRRERDLRVS